MELSNKRYNCFDREMAEATVEAYKKLDNSLMAQFSVYFEGIWFLYRESLDINEEGVEKTRDSFGYLREQLFDYAEELEGLPFKKKYTERIITVIEELLAV